MKYEKEDTVAQHREVSEQIDLIDLLLQIWRGKWIVAACVGIAVVIAGTYLSVAKEKWTSTAVISSPGVGLIASYINALNLTANDGTRYSTNDITNNIAGRFISSASALADTLASQVQPEKLSIEPAVKGQALPLKLSYQGRSAKESQTRLAQYIQQIDDAVSKELNNDLKENISTRTAELSASLLTLQKMAQEKKDLRLRQIAQALTVARDANVQAPQVTQIENVSQDTLFLLGSAALESMIKNEAARPLVFGDDYYQARQTLLDIQHVASDVKDIHAYSYVLKPTLPARRDSPKKALTLLLAAMLGGMVGAGYVLARSAIRSYQAKA